MPARGGRVGGSTSMSLISLSLYPSVSEPLGITMGLIPGRLECGVNIVIVLLVLCSSSKEPMRYVERDVNKARQDNRQAAYKVI